MKSRYPSIEHRMTAARLETLPPFWPERTSPAGEEAQKTLHRFMEHLYETLLERPEAFFSSLHEDGVFTHRFNRAYDKNPALQSAVRAANKKLDDLVELLFALGQRVRGDSIPALPSPPALRIPRRSRELLLRAGLAQGGEGALLCEGEHRGMFRALGWMAAREGASAAELRYCIFDRGHSYALDVFAPLLGDEGELRALAAFFEQNGYARGPNVRNGRLSLDYAKEYAKKPSPLKDAWAERSHGGICAMHYEYVQEAACLALRAPMLRALLERSARMEDGVRDFAAAAFKRCDGCGYCVQTDASGKRPRAFVRVETPDGQIPVCPLFPGFHACWPAVDAPLARGIEAFLRFADGQLGKS